MKSIFSKSHYGLASGVALWLSVLHFSGQAAENKTPPNSSEKQATPQNNPLEEYVLKHTVNFNNVSVTEVIRFVSKLTGYNFVFLQEDLNFNVSIVSEEPMSLKNITSALIQILRVHGLKLLEQDSNFVITKTTNNVNQIPAIISEDTPTSDPIKSPIATKIFRIKHANLQTLVNIIRPMVSAASLIETITQTQQLIVTDITTNLDKLSSLISLLDTPQSNLEIETYSVQYVTSDHLIDLTQKILAPFIGNSPFLLIPQKKTNTIFVVSTPYLIERTMTLLEDLDTESQAAIAGEFSFSTYIYKVLNQSPESLLENLKAIQAQIPSGTDPNLVQAIQTANYIPSAGSIVFITDVDTWNRLNALLTSIDTEPNPVGKTTFWVYKTNNNNPKQLLSALKQISASLQDKSLQATIGSVQWIPETGSLVFTGPEHSILKLQEMVPSVDLSTPQVEPKVFIYKILHTSEAQISTVLKQIAPTIADPAFSEAVGNMQLVKGSNSLIFKANPETIKQLEQILPSIDVETPEAHLYAYKVQKAQKTQITATLEQIAETTQDNGLAAAIHNMQWVVDSNTLLFSAPPKTIEKLERLLPTIDVSKLQAPHLEMFLYKIQNTTAEKIQTSLGQIQNTLKEKDLIDAINNMQWLSESHTFSFQGTADAIAQLKQILPMIDVKSESELFTYKVQNASEDLVVNALEQLASSSKDKDFVLAIKTMQELVDSHTLVFNTTPAVIAKLQTLLPKLDVAKSPATHLYKLKAAASTKITAALDQLAKTSQNKDLIDALKNRQWVADTQTFIFHGKEEAIAEVKKILQALDVETPQLELYVYKIHKAPDADITNALESIAKSSQDKELIQAIDTMEWIKTSHSLVFNATPEAVAKLKRLLPTLDVSTADMYLYPVKEASKESFTASLSQIAATSSDKELVNAINSLEWMDNNKTCIFHGTQNALEELQKILPSIDTPSTLQLYVYKVEQAKASDIENSLKQTSQTLQNKEFTAAVQSMKWVEDSHSLIFHATPSTISILKNLLPSLDATESSKRELYLYKIKKASQSQIASGLEQIEQATQDKELAFAIDHMQWIEKSNSLAFNTTPATYAKLQEILASLDIHLELYVYKLQNVSEEQISNSLKQIANKSQDKEFLLAVQTMQWIPDSKTLVFNTSAPVVDRLKTLLPTLDISSPEKTYLYKTQSGSEDRIRSTLKQIADSSKSREFIKIVENMQWVDSTKTFIFRGTEESIEELKKILPSIDFSSPELQMYMYTVKTASQDQIAASLGEIAKNSPNKELVSAIETMQWTGQGKTFIFHGTQNAITELKNILPSLDAAANHLQLYTYVITQAPEEQVAKALDQTSQTMQNKDFTTAVKTMRWIADSRTLVFNTTPSVIALLQNLLPTLDVLSTPKKQLYLYKLQSSKESVISALEQIGDTTQDKELAVAIDTMQWIEKSNTLAFNTTSSTITTLQSLLSSLDVQNAHIQLYAYKVKASSQEHMETALIQIQEGLDDPALITAIEGRKWLAGNKTYLFHATAGTIAELEKILSMIDTPKSDETQLYIYAIKNVPEAQIEAGLVQASQVANNKEFADAVENMQWMKESNTLIFNTTPGVIAKLQSLLPSLDNTAHPIQMYIYKLKTATESQMSSSLKQMANTEQDPDLAASLKDAQWMAATKTFVFHGTAETIMKLKEILPAFDVMSTPSLKLYIYKVQHAPEAQITTSLKQMANSVQDLDLANTLKDAQWMPATKTFVFHGTPETITKLTEILPTFDVTPAPSLKLYIYKLQHAPEAQMIASLNQMADTVQDPELANTLKGMQWMAATKTFVFHGTPETITKLNEILPTLDVTQAPSLKLYIYKIQHASEAQIAASLSQTAENMQNKDFSRAIEGMQWVQDSNALVFHTTTDVIAELQNLLPTLDIQKPGLQMYMYKTQNPTPSQLSSALQQMALHIQDKDLAQAINNMKWMAETKTFIFHGTAEAIAKLEKIIPTLDIVKPTTNQLYVYTVKHVSEAKIVSALEQMSEKMQDPDFMAAVESVHWIEGSHNLVFNTTPAVISQLQSLLPTIDVSAPQVYMYKVQTASPEQISTSLEKMAQTLQDKELSAAIHSMKWIEESHAFAFNGTPAAIAQLQNILPILDSTASSVASATSAKAQFLIYNPQNQKGEDLQKTLQELASNLKGSGLQNANLITALDSMKWVPSSNSLVFTGDSASLDKIRGILASADIPNSTNVFIYKPIYASEYQLQNALTQFAQKLDPSNPSDQLLAQAIQQMSWMQSSNSFVFKSDPATLARLKTTLSFLDSAQGLATIKTTHFSLYKLQYVQGDVIIKNLTNLANTLPSKDPNSEALIKAIQDLQWVKENNSLMITGSPYVVDQIKSFIAEFDTSAAAPAAVTNNGEFLIYKPLNRAPEELQQSLINLAKDLSVSSFANPDLVKALQTIRVVPSTHSLLITGTPEVLAKVKSLASSLDTKVADDTLIQAVGDTTFLIYKIKQAPHEDLIRSLQTFASQLSQSDVADQTLAKSLSSVNWIQETNSLMFTGPQETLRKVEALADKFDLGTLLPQQPPRETPATFVVYTPKAQKGSDLIGVLNEFMQNLIHSGISDPQLFDAISHLKFIDKTNSLIISGDPVSIQKIQELLVKFDMPSMNNGKSQVDASNFLIYKLQYHQGADILAALKKVAISLTNSAPEANQALIDAIDSLQWLEVTNSLLVTGDAAILAKLKTLVTNLDVPLRQVFIEVLVVETSLFNSQNFGLQWGSQLQYLNKTIGAMGNFPTVMNSNINSSGNQPPGTVNLGNPLSYTTNLNTPVQGNPLTSNTAVPFSTGFDLGVIGDILFHKGQSFISLGSLLNALQVDNDSTIIMNPKIITQDGHTSTIFVGQNIPFVGSFISNTASSTVQSSNIEYRDVGVNLVITPTLGTNNIITLDISQDISEQTPNTTSVQGSQVTGIQTSHTTMNTRVHVPDRHFLVLSGMIQDVKNHFRSGIPCLGGLPVIGALFAENDRTNTKSNVIIFLRPFIIDSFKDYDLLTANEEELYKTQAGLHDLKEEFDSATEMLKNLHND